MILANWKDLPEIMKNDDVLNYYRILEKKKGNLLIKRLFDIIASISLIIILSPLMVIIALWIKFDSKGPVIFKQNRITRYNAEFKIYKFRTMIQNAENKGSLVTKKNDSRITNVGNKIRKSRLDELPQLFNILKGEMTFVGTRPEVKRYVEQYTDEMYGTLLLPAGVTSLASIYYKEEDNVIEEHLNMNYTVDQAYLNYVLPAKMKYNLDYIKKETFFFDLKVCLLTIGIGKK